MVDPLVQIPYPSWTAVNPLTANILTMKSRCTSYFSRERSIRNVRGCWWTSSSISDVFHEFQTEQGRLPVIHFISVRTSIKMTYRCSD